ncbi:G-protein coupled receptor 84 [Ornithorhynchus anatinus]|uniref:G protein-coupled receptor 84 n=1 Tax=Ornithorhynchus anatinus TaxID=9258 RepID=F7A4K1_ORNAN|nr:G-protein coupled receptor 84 [Ornithorhynchus anatinus]
MFNDSSFSCAHPSVLGYRYVAVSWGVVVAVAGTVGNALTLLAFWAEPKLRTRFNALIANLTLADLLYCTVLQPFSVDTYLHLRWRTGGTFCRTFGLLLFASNSVSILTLCLIALGRFLLVARPALFGRIFSRRGVALAVASTWVAGLASFAPLWRVFVLVPAVCTCSFDRQRGRPYTTILMGFYFVVGLSCIGVFYCLIYQRVRGAARALRRYRLSRRGPPTQPENAPPGHYRELDSGLASGEPSSEQSTGQTQDGERASGDGEPGKAVGPEPWRGAPPRATAHTTTEGPSETGKVTRMCFVVFLFFVLSYIPFLLLNIIDMRGRAPRVLHMISANLTWLNSCINPVLYAAMNRQFRQAYGAVLLRGRHSFVRLR